MRCIQDLGERKIVKENCVKHSRRLGLLQGRAQVFVTLQEVVLMRKENYERTSISPEHPNVIPTNVIEAKLLHLL